MYCRSLRGWRAPLSLALILLATPGVAGLLTPRHPKIEHSVTTLGEWRLEIARNAFSGGIACRLAERHGHAVYRMGAVGFHFKRGWDVSGTVYRLDGAAPRVSRDDLPELIALRVPVDRGGPDNASGGIVWIPFARLAEANSVAIQPRPDRAARTFHFRGLKGLHELAVERGCTPDSRFVER